MIISQQSVPGAPSIDAPAATTNGDNYLLAWRSADQSLWWTTCAASQGQDGYDWRKSEQIPKAASSAGPALASLGGVAWLAWKGEGDDTRIFIASLKGTVWSAGVALAGLATSAAPALIATGSELYLAWKGGHDNQIYWSRSSDGKTWSAQAIVSGAASDDAPALTGFKGTVHLAWKGQKDNSLWWASRDANGWGAAKVADADFKSAAGPALAVGTAGNVHLAWKGAADASLSMAIFTTANGKWSAQTKIPVVATSARPALASQTSAATDILLAWKGASGDSLWVGPLDNLATDQAQAYTFALNQFQILNTRSGNIFSTSKDTDYASFGLTIGKSPPQVVTQSMGDLSNGSYPTNLAFRNVKIADNDNVILTYHIINSSVGESSATTYLQQTAFKLSSAGVQALSSAAAEALGAAIGGALGTAIPVPLIGSALGALAGWLLGSVWGVAFPDCDGPVAAGVHIFTGAQLRALTAKGQSVSTENNPGVNSPDGCGSNSNYNVTWSVAAG